jgi:hypothetical protein
MLSQIPLLFELVGFVYGLWLTEDDLVVEIHELWVSLNTHNICVFKVNVLKKKNMSQNIRKATKKTKV